MLKNLSIIFLFGIISILVKTTIAADLDTGVEKLERVKAIQLASPPFKAHSPKMSQPKAKRVNLNLISSKPNQITDERRWFEVHQLSLPIYRVPNSLNPGREVPDSNMGLPAKNLPAGIPLNYQNNNLVKVIHYSNRNFLIYGKDYASGRYLFSFNDRKDIFNYGYDFLNYMLAPQYEKGEREFIVQDLNWAIQEDESLYVSHAHRTYAKSSKGMNGYIRAINRKKNRVIWSSQPLVCNAENFEIVDDTIVCGYGFTAEPDFLYLLDKNTGKVIGQISLKSAPEYIIRKGNQLYVRTYDTDYIFKIVRN